MELIFKDLDSKYPIDDKGKPIKIKGACSSFEHQCAIRLSRAIQQSTNLDIFTGTDYTKKLGPVCKDGEYKHARGAEELAKYLVKRLSKPKKFKPPSRTELKGKKGIIFFKDIKGFRNGIGDHIDLWDGNGTKTGHYFDSAKEVWFWDLR